MAILKEYRCVGHDHPFEAYVSDDEVPECPFGCSPRFVRREFRTPVGIRHNGTTNMDLMTRQLASDYGMTDMRNDRDGSSVMSSTSVASGGAKMLQPFQKAKWEPSLFAPAPGWAASKLPTPTFKHPETMPGNKTQMEPLFQSMPRNLLQTKTVFQKPKEVKK
jgi:hypothetical protein